MVAAAPGQEIGALKSCYACVALAALVLLSACGSGPRTAQNAAPRGAVDPRTAPTATLPSSLPSPIPAGAVGTLQAGSTAASNPGTYTVKPGDTLAAIAGRLGLSLPDLTSANSDVNPASLRVGQELRIPPSPSATPSGTANAGSGATGTPARGVTASAVAATTAVPGSGSPTSTSGSGGITGPQTYKVQSGDTACKIATNFHVSIQELAEANRTSAAGLAQLKIGQELQIPAATGSPRGC